MFNGIELRVRICPESKTFKIQKDWLNILDLAGEVLTDWSIVDGIIEEFLSYSVITNSINVGFLIEMETLEQYKFHMELN